MSNRKWIVSFEKLLIEVIAWRYHRFSWTQRKELGLGESFGKNLKMSKVAEWVGLRHKISRTEVKSLSNIVMEKSEETRFIRLYN